MVGLQLSANAPATLRKYRAGWQRWLTWALFKSCIPVIYAEPLYVALFLADLPKAAKENFRDFSSLEGVSYSIASVYKVAGFQISPTEQPFVNSTLEGGRCSLAQSIRPKETLPLESVQSVATH